MNNKQVLVHRPRTHAVEDEADRSYREGWNAANQCVVRCKDCTFAKRPIEYGDMEVKCKVFNMLVDLKGFCSYGEAKAVKQ